MTAHLEPIDLDTVKKAVEITEEMTYGYVVVIQDCRGRHGSEGRFSKYVNEAGSPSPYC